MTGTELTRVRRSEFRGHFQPSRVTIGLFPSPRAASGVNPITLCYTMHGSHRDRTVILAVEECNESQAIARDAAEFVLAVPSGQMVDQAMYCGTVSLREDPDKVGTAGLTLTDSLDVQVPSLSHAIGNIECRTTRLIDNGDHLLVVGAVQAYTLGAASNELPLLSIGPDLRGYRLLRHQGIHRLAVVDAGDAQS